MAPVYAAKYSNVLVWVSTVKNVSVMRRQGDGWVNATHLLKVADFDKPRRTRILERDVQTGEHEKVQGGYGKYQGTWIPVERAMKLSQEVGILDIVRDLLVYVPVEGVETALLPKQLKPVTAARKHTKSDASNGPVSKPKRAKKTNSVPEPAPMPIAPRAQAMQSMPPALNRTIGSAVGGTVNPPLNGAVNGSYQQVQWPQFSPQSPYGQPQSVQLTPQQQQQMGVSTAGIPQMPVVPIAGFATSVPNGAMYQQTPYEDANGDARGAGDRSNASSPSLSSSVLSSGSDGLSDDGRPYLGGSSFHRMRRAGTEPVVTAMRNSGVLGSSEAHLRAVQIAPRPCQYMADYSSKLLDYFMSPDKNMIPAALLHPQPGTHLNQPIDDEGNTAFHWTCAIGKIELIQALLDAGADKKALNFAGQTPLVRAVMFTNNYEARTFSRVLELLIETVSIFDNAERTILHHIAITASSGSRFTGARYYTEILLGKLSASPELLSMGFTEWLNHQDQRGDTALHISSRGDSRRLAKILLSYQASSVLPNKAGITAEELLKRSRGRTEADTKSRSSSHQGSEKHSERRDGVAVQAARETELAISHYLLEFGKTYDTDLMNKDSDISQVRQLMDQLCKRVSDTSQHIKKLQEDLGPEKDVITETEKLEAEAKKKSEELYQLMERSQARDLASMVQKEEADVQGELNDQIAKETAYNESEQTELSRQLADMQQRRKSLLEEIVALHGNAGSREKIGKYRKLLAMCCEVPEEEVDGLLDGITNALGTQST